MILFIAGISIILMQFSDAYVLLQVRKKDNNHSNIDALIHKVIPSDKIEKFTQKLARKPFKLHNDDAIENGIENDGKEETSMSVDDKSEPNLIKLFDLAIDRITKPGGAIMRSNDQENNLFTEPKNIKFRTGESSVLYEINSQSLIKVLEELLSSKIVRRYLDKLTREAAVVYRSMKESKQK